MKAAGQEGKQAAGQAAEVIEEQSLSQKKSKKHH
jgi:hypothetical protein